MVLKLILRHSPINTVPLFLLKLVNLYLEMPYLPWIKLSWLLELTNILLHYFVKSFSVSLYFEKNIDIQYFTYKKKQIIGEG